jgi:hypothetical protein
MDGTIDSGGDLLSPPVAPAVPPGDRPVEDLVHLAHPDLGGLQTRRVKPVSRQCGTHLLQRSARSYGVEVPPTLKPATWVKAGVTPPRRRRLNACQEPGPQQEAGAGQEAGP